jgi:hypothetical protein
MECPLPEKAGPSGFATSQSRRSLERHDKNRESDQVITGQSKLGMTIGAASRRRFPSVGWFKTIPTIAASYGISNDYSAIRVL